MIKIFFEVNGTKFKVISTESTGRGEFDCIDTIMNLETEKISKINRKKTVEYQN